MLMQRRSRFYFLCLVAIMCIVVRAESDDISNPSGGGDAAAIIQQSKQMMHTSADAADGTSDGNDDAKSTPKASNATGQSFPGGQNSKNMKSHGTCVTGCATQSTQGVGCGSDLSKPECFCKSQDFIVQAFTCVNATCPEQYHGAAGVFMSICGVVGGPGIEIPGYASSGNLEHMPQVIPDNGTTNGTQHSGTEPVVAPPAGIIVTPPHASQGAPSNSSSDSSSSHSASSAAVLGKTAKAANVLCASAMATALLVAGIFVLL